MAASPWWIDPSSWLEASGELGRRVANATPLDGSNEIYGALATDPRRLAAVVGDAPDASAVALAIARAAPNAWYLDPAWLPDPTAALAELERRLLEVPGNARPVVVIDIDPPALAAVLAPLVSRRLVPRLLVVVPCTRVWAIRLAALAGGYPRSSILVIAAGNAASTPLEISDEPPRLVPAMHRTLRRQAEVLLLEGRFAEAAEKCSEAVAAAAGEDLAASLSCVALRADIEWQRGDRDKSCMLYREVVAGRRALGDAAGTASALQSTAEITRDLRRHDEAAALLEEALALWVTLGDLPAEARCRLRLGQFADRRADPAAAAMHYEAALARFRAMGVPPESLERLAADLDAARAAAAGAGPARERQGAPPKPETPPSSDATEVLIPLDVERRR
ncbi:MAG TPA: tetratricopeptide repeat protein [Kofleriaceae bacterium]